MALQPHRSLLTPIEQLPPYSPSPRELDWETSSIRSTAPSYVSAAPSYRSTVPPCHNSLTEQPAGNCSSRIRPDHSSQPYTNGGAGVYHRSSSRTLGSSVSNSHLDHSLYNIVKWVPVTEGMQARHYHNVAKRRATEASTGLDLVRSVSPRLHRHSSSIVETGRADSSRGHLTSLSSPQSSSFSSEPSSSFQPSPSAGFSESQTSRWTTPSPLAEEKAFMQEESKSWDFMTSEMADWQRRKRERERSKKDEPSATTDLQQQVISGRVAMVAHHSQGRTTTTGSRSSYTAANSSDPDDGGNEQGSPVSSSSNLTKKLKKRVSELVLSLRAS
ncbi:hypothetical protein T310_1520 [Rasamsonia emersonii CBS 393.64]|uniref:Uncharacterized protein n=1 Tax=Rasamsonia emersonii (strain ATCC 16479 / CBS 393.64 / IMI 116815) TaxID=1408163 RepID=A0A0F4Z324_RASE3|nr:hypothetical protein T310_1520 [Rasamsonia emersonii CBS 393.64]KKA24491.1 hypothetical protein T310_1520 [Rasamsonia emersonii CBS 393.64]